MLNRTTEGPWTYAVRLEGEGMPTGYAVEGSDGPSKPICTVWNNEDNARMIAALPDLMAALLDVLSDYEGEYATAARKAVSKALGE